MTRIFKLLVTVAGILVIVPTLIWACGLIIFTGSICSMVTIKNPERTDAMIVLTGGANRVSRGFDLLARGKAQYLLISGVHKDAKLNELVKIWGSKRTLPDCCITLGREAENTIGNSIEAQKWVARNKVKTVRLITANYHMPRALVEFRHTLPGITIIPDPVIPKNFNPRQSEFWKITFTEYHKLILSTVRVLFFPSDTSPVPQALK